MKKVLSLFILVVILCSCSDDFLDRQPEDTLSPGIFFKNPTDIKAGLIAVYQPLQNIFSAESLPHILGQMSGDGTRAYNTSVWHTFFKNNTNSAPELWNGFYKVIVNANNIIDVIDKYTPKNAAEEEVVKVFRGEASYLRAFAYFYLVRLYGDLPMVVSRFEDPGTAFGMGRTPAIDIYTKIIIPDLEYAFANCYKKDDPGIGGEGARATKGSALTMLGEVYLTIKDPANAAATLKKLIVDKAAGNYMLLTDYSKIWLPTNKFHSESIFEINYNAAVGMGSEYFLNWSIAAAYIYGGQRGNGYFVAEKDLMDEFAASNEVIRYKVSVDSAFTNNLIQPAPIKLSPPLSEGRFYEQTGTDYNYMVTRYADALLMYSEALMLIGQEDVAAPYVNQVRARVNMPDLTAVDLDITRILHERRMELAFEGHRYFDLVRTGKAIEYISKILMSDNEYEKRVWRTAPIPEYQLLLPIPVIEIEKDRTLTQNSGY